MFINLKCRTSITYYHYGIKYSMYDLLYVVKYFVSPHSCNTDHIRQMVLG